MGGGDVDLTGEQRRAVGHEGPALVVAGGPGTGKTTVLAARHARLAAGAGGAGRVLVVARDRGAARRFRDALLPGLAGGFDALPVTTAWGLAYDVVTRHEGPVRLLGRGEQRAFVARLLRDEGKEQWPALHPLVGRPAFTSEVVEALGRVAEAGLPDGEVARRAAAAGGGDRWAELVAFAGRYRAALRRAGATDGVELLRRAAGVLAADEGARRAAGERFRAVLVDDGEWLPLAAVGLLAALVDALGAGGGGGPPVTVAVDPSAPGAAAWLDPAPGPGPSAAAATTRPGGSAGEGAGPGPPERRSRTDGPRAVLGGSAAAPVWPAGAVTVALSRPFPEPPPPELVTAHHPALEAEAVAAELLAAAEEGVAWGDMAVLVRRLHPRARAVGRALARHGIPVAVPPGAPADDPSVRAVVDLLRWAAGDEGAAARLVGSPLAGLDPAGARAVQRRARAEGRPLDADPELAALVALRDDLRGRAAGDDPATLAFEVWRRGLAPLVGDAGGHGPDDRALDALVAFFDGLDRWVERHPGGRLADWLADLDAGGDRADDAGPDPWRSTAGDGAVPGGAVTIDTVERAAGRRWAVVVVPGCVEGELPAPAPPTRFFDHALLGPGAGAATAGRRAAALAAERHLFAVARSRGTRRVVLVAAPPAGVLLSRFAEGLDARPARLAPLGAGPPPLPKAPTRNEAPAWPDGRLRLSATQLDTYADCPKRYGYQYVLHLPRASGAAADLGSLVHAVLAEFCDPARPGERDRDTLMALAAAHWRDDLAPYRPQVEELRRDFYEMLDAWWDDEGERTTDVVAVERRFDVEVGPHRVTGAIDRIDRLPDGRLRIVDYKTGKTEPSADEVADDMQLATYHLAARRDPELAALGPPAELGLRFLRSTHWVERPVADDLEATTEARILDLADRMLAEEFDPSPTAHCDYCHLQRLCPLWPEGREVGA